MRKFNPDLIDQDLGSITLLLVEQAYTRGCQLLMNLSGAVAPCAGKIAIGDHDRMDNAALPDESDS